MPKINLLNKKRNKIIRKGHERENSVWIIATKLKQNNREYYVHKSDDLHTIIWTSCATSAMKFHTEIGCQHFIHTFMKNRTDIHLICVEEE